MSYDHAALFREIYRYVVAHPSHSLTQLASVLCVSARTIQLVVSKVTGMTFRDMRSRILLVVAAKKMNVQSIASIKEVSRELGFTSGRHFARCIRDCSGLSPSQLRRASQDGTLSLVDLESHGWLLRRTEERELPDMRLPA